MEDLDAEESGMGSTEYAAPAPDAVERPVPPRGPLVHKYGSDLVVDVLRALGVRYLPLNPGSSFRGLHDSVVNYGGNVDPQLLLCVHEEIAVALAHGYAKASGGLAVAAVHDLVGLMHASMAVYDAYCDRAPVLVLGGSGPADPRARRRIDWIHSATTQAELVRDFVVWDAEPLTPESFVDDILRAVQRVTSAPRGPGYVSLDAAGQEVRLDGDITIPDLALHQGAPPMPAHPDSVRAAADLLVGARCPVVIAGRTGLDARSTETLVGLVELLGAAFLNDTNMVSFPTSHRLNLTGDREILAAADVILAVDVVDLPGLLVPAHRGRRDARREARAQPAIIDLSHGDLGLRSWANVGARPNPRTIQLLADPLTGLEQLVEALSARVDPMTARQRAEEVAERSEHLRRTRRATIAERWDDRPITPARLVGDLWSVVRDVDWLLCLRNTRTWPEGLWEFSGAGQYLGHSGGGGVGYGPGAAVGGALAARDRGQLGVAIIGDGDFLMAAGALWTAVHYRIPLLLVINDNSSFYNDEPHQAEVAIQRGRPVENSWIGMRMADPRIDLAGLARSYGCWATGPIEEPADLSAAFEEALGQALAGEVAVVHVRTAPE